jgi:ribonuclease P protein component
MRFTPHQHIKQLSDFQKIRSSGLRRESGFFCLNYLVCPEREPALRRLGVIATRRYGNAVQRNRAKRRLREAFRECQNALPPSVDVVLIVRNRLRHADHTQLVKAIRAAFAKVEAAKTQHS